MRCVGMHPFLHHFFGFLGAVSVCAATMGCSTHASRQSSLPSSAIAAETTEQQAERALRQELLARRQLQVRRLREYAAAGVFPRNDFQLGTISMLVDRSGRPCAMAYLVIASGEEELIAQLAQQDNTLLFGDVREGRLLDWILSSGLTQEEAAFVQEPDMYIDGDWPGAANLQSLEDSRLRAHFMSAAQRIEMTTETSINTAMARLVPRARPTPRDAE